MSQKIIKSKTYFVLALLSFIELSTHVFSKIFSFSSTLNILFKFFGGLFVILLLLGWYYKRKENAGQGKLETKTSKYMFLVVAGGLAAIFTLITLFGFLNFIKNV